MESFGFIRDNADFYPRPHMEGDKLQNSRQNFVDHFYPRPHMEGDVIENAWAELGFKFLPTPSHGGRQYQL